MMSPNKVPGYLRECVPFFEGPVKVFVFNWKYYLRTIPRMLSEAFTRLVSCADHTWRSSEHYELKCCNFSLLDSLG